MTEPDRTSGGILAIFNNVAPGREAEFEDWFQREHLAERIAGPGFLPGRRYEAVFADGAATGIYRLLCDIRPRQVSSGETIA